VNWVREIAFFMFFSFLSDRRRKNKIWTMPLPPLPYYYMCTSFHTLYEIMIMPLLVVIIHSELIKDIVLLLVVHLMGVLMIRRKKAGGGGTVVFVTLSCILCSYGCLAATIKRSYLSH